MAGKENSLWKADFSTIIAVILHRSFLVAGAGEGAEKKKGRAREEASKANEGG